VDPIVGLKSMEVIVQLKKEYQDLITIQIAVFAQEGITNHTGQVEMMREAMIMGQYQISIYVLMYVHFYEYLYT
jgi:cytosine deaminase